MRYLHLIKSSIVGALGGLLFGFDTAVISGTTHSLVETFRLDPAALGITVSSALWGTVISAMLAGIPGEKLGARESLRITAALYVVSALGCALAWNWWSLLIFRFIGGLGIGASSVLGPVYIAELAPAAWRGRLVGMFQVNIVIGILLAYFSNYVIGLQHLGMDEWRWQLGVSALPAVLFLLMLFFIPRSPRWLVSRGLRDEARAVLQLTGVGDPDAELQEIVASLGEEVSRQKERLFSRKYLKPIFLALTIGMFNQLSGINAILYYLNDIFAKAGFSSLSGNIQAVIVGGTNLVFTLFAMASIDKFGRKPLLLIGAVGTALCLFGVAAIFYMHANENALIWLLMAYIGFFAFSQGSVIWVYISEIFPTPVRARGQSLGSSSHWVMNAIISAAFPVVAQSSGGLPFAVFGVMMIVQLIVVLLYYPETKGVSLEELQHKLGIG
ncbi:MAG: sugar porter family MFS transporter [Candidatus Obscuribacterales bacterium]